MATSAEYVARLQKGEDVELRFLSEDNTVHHLRFSQYDMLYRDPPTSGCEWWSSGWCGEDASRKLLAVGGLSCNDGILSATEDPGESDDDEEEGAGDVAVAVRRAQLSNDEYGPTAPGAKRESFLASVAALAKEIGLPCETPPAAGKGGKGGKGKGKGGPQLDAARARAREAATEQGRIRGVRVNDTDGLPDASM